ncbi:MAG: aminopeptidase P family protein [Rhodoluna sp.]|nr:aminopeptidase P family protein [Rhodoluna sp.]
MSNDATKPNATPETKSDPGANRSRTPTSQQFLDYMGSGWADAASGETKRSQVADYTPDRRAKVAAAFAGEVILIEAGPAATRSNDTEYRYRPHSAFAHLTGWGAHTVPDSVLVIDARQETTHSILFLRETAGKDSSEFFANSAIGEFWVGQRPSLIEVGQLLDLETRSLSDFEKYTESLGKNIITLEHPALAEFVSELRLVKDQYEISEMRKAVDASIKGFEQVVANLGKAKTHPRGERIVETAFFTEARANGNDLGYETIAAAGDHACTLHWIINNGPVRDGDLLLLDAGVEMESLYTADVTRTIPINGKFSTIQRQVYEAVLEAADAVFAMAKPGVLFKDMHATAMRVIAEKTHGWGFLPGSIEDSLNPENQHHRRWMVHGTGHHLGLDVHDCAQARREMSMEAELKPGMIFTIEPGLYFHRNDLLVPEEFRGIGVRIEDDVVVTETGVENLTAALPRKVDELEAWLAKHSA